MKKLEPIIKVGITVIGHKYFRVTKLFGVQIWRRNQTWTKATKAEMKKYMI